MWQIKQKSTEKSHWGWWNQCKVANDENQSEEAQ